MTDVSRAGEMLVLFLDAECDTERARYATIGGERFEAVAGYANAGGERRALRDVIAIRAPQGRPDARLIGEEIALAWGV